MKAIEPTDTGTADVQATVGRWWMRYDLADFDAMAAMLTRDVHFTCRTSTGTTAFEEFVRADHRGRDEVMAWQREHRLDSPYPLRHMALNLHPVGRDGDDTTFASYLFVTQIVGGAVANLSTAIVHGAVRAIDGVGCLSALHVVLDTEDSAPLRTRAT